VHGNFFLNLRKIVEMLHVRHSCRGFGDISQDITKNHHLSAPDLGR
jgi:hypothetical protein